VADPVWHQGRWWYQQPDGSWLLWNEGASRWEAPPLTQAPAQEATTSTDAYRDLSTRGAWLVGLLALGAVVDAIAVASDLAEYALVSRVTRGFLVTEQEALANDARQGLIGLIQSGIYIATIVAFLMWFWAAYANLPVLGATNLRFKRGWSVGAWFVPFLNLVRPKQIADDIWRASDPELPPEQADQWRGRAVAPLLHWWWAAFLISGWVGTTALRLSLELETLDQIRTASSFRIASDVTSAAAAVLALVFVRAATRRQQARAALIGAHTR
jgi:hypothetical protein